MLPPVRLLAMMGGLPGPVNIDPMPIERALTVKIVPITFAGRTFHW
jgi:hypothetical protein